MRRLFGFGSVFFAVALSLPLFLFAQDEKKDDDKKDEKKKTAPPVENITWGRIITNVRIKNADAGEIVINTIDPVKLQKYQAWLASNRLNALKNPAQFQQQNLQQQQNLFSAEPTIFKAAEGLKVRSVNLPVEYDDRGNLKKWSEADKAKLKGSGKLPGYASDIANLRDGQIVDLYLKKEDKKATPSVTTKGKGAEPDFSGRPEVVMVLIKTPMGPQP